MCGLSVSHLVFLVCIMETLEVHGRHNILRLPGCRSQYLAGTNMFFRFNLGFNKIEDTEFETGWILGNSHFQIRFITNKYVFEICEDRVHRENQI